MSNGRFDGRPGQFAAESLREAGMRRSLATGSVIFAVAMASCVACSSGSGSGGGGGGSAGAATGGSGGGAGAGSGGAAGTGTGGTGTGGNAGSGTGGTGTGGSGGGYCPTADLGSTLPIIYDGSTAGKPNIVTSSRLEWTDAGDDALLFTAPAAGTYRISMPSALDGCGASVREYGPAMNGMGEIYSPSWCPAQGSSVEIDGVFAAYPPDGTDDVDLASGQQVVIWVSCAYWASTLEGAYQIKIEQI